MSKSTANGHGFNSYAKLPKESLGKFWASWSDSFEANCRLLLVRSIDMANKDFNYTYRIT
jgi:hypothetical protein